MPSKTQLPRLGYHQANMTAAPEERTARGDASERETYALPGMLVTNRRFDVPLDHAAPEGERISIFARELVARERRADDLPYLVFFQGGPGSPSPRPEAKGGWIGRALERYRVLLLDQRGTGLSTPVHHRTLAERGDARAQADYLAHFRADSIVADAELIRRELIGDERWAILGQSFGGFCVLRYLSVAQEALSAAFITGGIPSLDRPAEDVYRATYPRVARQNREFFSRYPHAQPLAQRIADHLLANEVTLPNGQPFTVPSFQQLGMALGASGGFERLMDLLERAFVTVNGREELSYPFLHDVFCEIGFNANPIFTLLHEPIYAQGEATRWAAQRVRQEFPEFDYAPGQEFLFTGEMIYPWMLDTYAALAPMKEVAELLAAKSDWPRLYDPEVLAANRVPTAAALYFHDMYVDLDLALETAARVANLEVWVTSEYEHNGLRADGARVLGRLFEMLPLDGR